MTDLNDMQLLVRAIEFAARKHRMQRRKDVDASPYINHPIALMSVLCVEAGIDDVNVLVAAALHDTVEDTETTFAELRQEFGEKISGYVAELTDDKTLPTAERKRLQIEHACTMSAEAGQVKLADKICNIRDVGSSPPVDWNESRCRDYFEWAKAVVVGLPNPNPKLRKRFDEAYEQGGAATSKKKVIEKSADNAGEGASGACDRQLT